MLDLRPYQQRAVADVLQAWQSGARRVCLVMPTGSGKTVTARTVAEQLGGRALWLVHRTELAAQAPGLAVTIQALVASGARPECDVLIADECHHLAPGAPEWHAVAAYYPRILGLTATPQRQDGSALGDLFDALVVGAQYSELLAGGWIVPARVFRPAEEVQGVAERPAAAWGRLAAAEGNGARGTPGARGFAFFGRVELAQQFAAEVPGTAAVWGDQDAGERAAALARFRAGELSCLANVQVLTEGVDVPEASVCLLATGCQHAGGYLQRVGRVLRPFPGKSSALVIDLPGASHRHGLPTEDREYSLSGRPIRCKVESLSVCKACGCTHPSSDPSCPSCGRVEPPRPARLRVWGVPLEEVGAAAVLTPQQRAVLRYRQGLVEAPVGRLRVMYQKLRATAEERGYSPKWPAVQFKIRVGRWPGAQERAEFEDAVNAARDAGDGRELGDP